MTDRDNDPNVIRGERFSADLSDLVYSEPMCYTCRHWNGQPSDSKCTAFGDDPIPWDILAGDHDHHLHYPGDHGIRYSPVEGAPE